MSTASDRIDRLGRFLLRAGWADADRRPLAGDASTRRYDRVRRGAETAVLMDAPPGAERPACPPEADGGVRAGLGYNALARLAGPNTSAFAGLSQELVARGFSAPRVLAADHDDGFLLLEDLGDDLFARVIEAGATPAPLYEAAIDLLAAVRRSTFPSEVAASGGRAWPVLAYDAVALQTEADLFLDWYVARREGRTVDAAARAEWTAAWREQLDAIARTPPTLTLRDVHAENLIWLPDREGAARAGVIDFQDALFGHPAYDVVSLLEDARRDVNPRLADAMKARFVAAAGEIDAAAFERAYAVLGAQRNAKILGIFVRLAERDGKPKYLNFLPRVARHFVGDLAHPALADVAAWTRANAPGVFEEAGR